MAGSPNAALLSECRAAGAAWQRLAASRTGAGLMFGWALTEAIVCPIIPDFLLFPLAADAGRRFLWLLAVDVWRLARSEEGEEAPGPPAGSPLTAGEASLRERHV